ncbi:MAG: ABC transporter substrate-binding protein [Clostridia bacterium]
MQIIDDYVRLRNSWQEHSTGAPFPVTLDQIAVVLCCTPRNAKLILKKWIERNLIAWVPGRGRGHRSTLVFHVEPDDLIDGIAKDLIQQGNIQKALALIDRYAVTHPMAAERFSQWFRGYFGGHQLQEGGTDFDALRLRLHRPELVLDPAHIVLRSQCHLVKQLCDTLVRHDPATQTIEPHLAHHWQTNARGDQWFFYLRKGVLFHNGHTLTAHDVKFSLERVRLEKGEGSSPYRWLLQSVKQIEVEGERTVRIDLHQPNHLFLQLLASEHLSILPKQYCQEMGERFGRQLVGTGPFKLVRSDESMLVLEAFQTYFRERALLDRIELVVVPDSAIASRLLEDSAFWIRYTSDAEESETKQGWKSSERLEWSVQFISCNLRKEGPLRDPLFREAIDRLLDRNEMLRELGGNRVETAEGMFPFPSEPIQETPKSQTDPRDLLHKSGYRGEVLRLHTFSEQDHREDAEWIRARCAMYGIAVDIAYFSAEELLQPSCYKAADLIHDSATIGDDWEVSMLQTVLAENSFLWLHADDQLRQEAAVWTSRIFATDSRTERLTLLKQLERVLLKKKSFLPLYRNAARLLSHPRLQGVTINAQGWVDYARLWFDTKKP